MSKSMFWKLGIFFLFSLVFVRGAEISFDGTTINIFECNGANCSNWNVTGGNILPRDGTVALRIPSLTGCDTIDTDSNGLFSCGSDATGGGSDASVWNYANNQSGRENAYFRRVNITDFFGVDNGSVIKLDNLSNINISNTTYASRVNCAGIVGASSNICTITSGGSSNVNNTDVNLTRVFIYTNLSVNSTINLTNLGDIRLAGDVFVHSQRVNYSIDLTLYNQSISLVNYLQAGQASNFLLSNVSNNTLVKGDNTSITGYFDTNNFKLSNVSNNTLFRGDNVTLAVWNQTSTTIFQRDLDKKVGIGTSNPTEMLQVGGRTFLKTTAVIGNYSPATFVFLSGTTLVNVTNQLLITDSDNTGTHGVMVAQRYGAGGNFFGSRANNDVNDPTVPAATNPLFTILGMSYHSNSSLGPTYSTAGAISIQVDAIDTPRENSTPGQMVFQTTPNGSTTQVTRLTIRENGFIGANTTTPNATLQVDGTFKVRTGQGADALFVSANGRVGIGGIGSPNSTFSLAPTRTALADDWTVRSNEIFKFNITEFSPELDLNPIHTFRYRTNASIPHEFFDENNVSYIFFENLTSREYYGLLINSSDTSIPSYIKSEDDTGISLYSLVTLLVDTLKKEQRVNLNQTISNTLQALKINILGNRVDNITNETGILKNQTGDLQNRVANLTSVVSGLSLGGYNRTKDYQSTTNTVTSFVTSNWLQYPLLASTNYSFECSIFYNSSSINTGIALSVNCPAVNSGVSVIYSIPGVIINSSKQCSNNYHKSPSTVFNSSFQIARIEGEIRTALAGSFDVNFASEVSGSSVGINTGSHCEFTQYSN